MKVRVDAIIFLTFNLLMILPILWLLDSDCNKYITIVAIIQLVSSIKYMRKIGIPYFSLQIIFVLISTIMHFGQAFLISIGRTDLFDYTNLYLARSMELYNKANIFALLIQCFVVFGILNVRKSLKNNEIINLNIYNENNDANNNRVFQIGLILFSFGIAPKFIYYFTQVKIILGGGIYYCIRQAIDYGPFMLLALFYSPGLIMMLIGSIKKKSRAKVIIIFGIIFELFGTLSGNRAQQILMIITYIYIYYRLISKLTMRRTIQFLLTSYFGISALYFISRYRNFNIYDSSLLRNRIIDVFHNEPIYSLLAQLGSNLNVVVLAMLSIPSYHSFNYGFTYLISWLSIYPNTGGLLGDIPKMYAFLNYLDTNLPLGGSFIGELYFNFGWISFPFAILVGLFIGNIGQKIETSISEKSWVKLSCYMTIFPQLLWWIRDYISSWIYTSFWSIFAIFIINSIIERNSNVDKKAYKKLENR